MTGKYPAVEKVRQATLEMKQFLMRLKRFFLPKYWNSIFRFNTFLLLDQGLWIM